MTAALPRGLRNNNPGNIEWGNFSKLYGATGPEPAGRFAVFPTMIDGLRAMAELLIVYATKPDGRGGKIDTVREVISRWCEPPIEAYITFACTVLDCNPDDEFDFTADFLFWMVTAIGEHENGPAAFTANVTDAQINDAIRLALAS